MSSQPRLYPRLKTWAWYVPDDPPHDDPSLISTTPWSEPTRATRRLLVAQPRGVIGILISMVISAPIGALTSLLIGQATEHAFTETSWWTLGFPVLAVMVILYVQYLSEASADAFTDMSQTRTTHTLRLGLLDRLLASPAALNPGRLLNTVDEDSDFVGKLKQILNFPIMMVGYLTGGIIVIAPISWQVAIAMPVGAICTALVSGATAARCPARLRSAAPRKPPRSLSPRT